MSTPRSSTTRAASRGRADDGNAAIRLVPLLCRVVVDEADRAQTRLRVLDELVDDGAPEPPGADDEDVPHAEPVAPGLLEVAADRGAAREDEEDVGDEEEEQDERASRRSPR